jgi:hypothetical protein
VELSQHDPALRTGRAANSERAAAWRFERIYGAFPGRNVMADDNAAVERSAKRYIDLLRDR